ncbi:hypothetical protein HYS84_02120 [Candidatus Saccharibacteria bacterium]|nr:hypothetical protein [Candidatus Saccharibacteria bacterium]
MPKRKSKFLGRPRFFSTTDKSIARLHRNHKDLSTKINQSRENGDSAQKNKYRQTNKNSSHKYSTETH